MTAAAWSLLALLVALALSMATRVNVGIVAIGLASLVGAFAAGLTPAEIASGFPTGLFLTLTAISLLFACAEDNGTLAAIAERAARATLSRPRLLPVLVFALAFALAALGPGAISAVALLAPLVMAMAPRFGISPFLMALLLCNGANAGNLSPISAVGVIANDKMAQAGLAGQEWRVFLANAAAFTLVAALATLWLARRRAAAPDPAAAAGAEPAPAPAFDRARTVTAVTVGAWIVGVLAFDLHLGLSAFIAVAILLLLRAADERGAIARTPWSVVLMVTGVSTLIALLERTAGLELFASWIARLATPATLTGTIALVVGLISTYSSTSGVVLPAFLPMSNALCVQSGGGDPLAVALAINLGASLVDVSPFSTLGALCIATQRDRAPALFRQLLVWALAMVAAGALLAQAGAGLIARL